MNTKLFFATITLLFMFNIGYNQNHDNPEHHDFKHFRVSALLGHAFSPEVETETSTFLLIPTLGLDIQYWFNHKWGIALKNDIEFAEYLVEDGGSSSDPLIERNYPFIVAMPVLYSPWDRTHFTFIVGPGIEFSPKKNFVVFRVGVGSEFDLGNHWDFAPELIYDLKNGHINMLTFALGVGKRF